MKTQIYKTNKTNIYAKEIALSTIIMYIRRQTAKCRLKESADRRKMWDTKMVGFEIAPTSHIAHRTSNTSCIVISTIFTNILMRKEKKTTTHTRTQRRRYTRNRVFQYFYYIHYLYCEIYNDINVNLSSHFMWFGLNT